MKITKNLYIAWVMVLPLLTGCGKTDDEYLIEKAYIHDYPEKSASKGTVYIATPYNQNACDSHKALLQGYVLIGKANFTSYPVAPSACIKFGRKMGAEAVIVSLSDKKEVVKYKSVAIPDKEIRKTTEEHTNALGTISDSMIDALCDTLFDSKRNRITITPKNKEETQTIYKYVKQPYVEMHYTHTLLFLKKTNACKAPWEYSIKDFISQQKQQEDDGNYIGEWVHYQIGKLNLLATDSEYVAFIGKDKKYKNKEKCIINRKLKWKNGDIKLRINKSSKQGFYLDNNKIPIPVYILLNQSDQLEVREQQTNKVIITLYHLHPKK